MWAYLMYVYLSRIGHLLFYDAIVVKLTELDRDDKRDCITCHRGSLVAVRSFKCYLKKQI